MPIQERSALFGFIIARADTKIFSNFYKMCIPEAQHRGLTEFLRRILHILTTSFVSFFLCNFIFLSRTKTDATSGFRPMLLHSESSNASEGRSGDEKNVRKAFAAIRRYAFLECTSLSGIVRSLTDPLTGFSIDHPLTY